MILGALAGHTQTIEVGATYRRFGSGALVETAFVLEVGPDRMGIPHVRFRLQVARGNGTPTIETRTLALEAFQNKFKDRVKNL